MKNRKTLTFAGQVGAGGRSWALVCLPFTVLLLEPSPLLQAGARIDTLKSFGLTGMSGSEPATALLEGSDGKLYGTTSKGGPGNAATLFRLDRDGNNYSVLVCLPGATAVSALAEGADGQLYGVKTATLGTNATDTTYGTVFKIGEDGSGFSALHTFIKDATATAPGRAAACWWRRTGRFMARLPVAA